MAIYRHVRQNGIPLCLANNESGGIPMQFQILKTAEFSDHDPADYAHQVHHD